MWHESQRIRSLPDGSITLQLELGGLEEIERWVLGWGSHVRVLEPALLAKGIRAAAASIVKLYQQGGRS
jgi:predicted DNA-binding transcriptional regulator YafY